MIHLTSLFLQAKMVQYLEFGKAKADSGRIEELEKQLNIEMSEKKKLREQVLKLEKDLVSEEFCLSMIFCAFYAYRIKDSGAYSFGLSVCLSVCPRKKL